MKRNVKTMIEKLNSLSIKQADFAKMLGLTPSVVSSWVTREAIPEDRVGSVFLLLNELENVREKCIEVIKNSDLAKMADPSITADVYFKSLPKLLGLKPPVLSRKINAAIYEQLSEEKIISALKKYGEFKVLKWDSVEKVILIPRKV